MGWGEGVGRGGEGGRRGMSGVAGGGEAPGVLLSLSLMIAEDEASVEAEGGRCRKWQFV